MVPKKFKDEVFHSGREVPSKRTTVSTVFMFVANGPVAIDMLPLEHCDMDNVWKWHE